MLRSTVSKLFFGSLIAAVGGLVMCVVAVIVAATTDGLIMRGPDVVGVHSNGAGVAVVVVAVLSMLLLLGAAVAQFVAWIGGVINTAALSDKTWFVVLLVVGLLGFVLVANILYLAARPDQPSIDATLRPERSPGAPAVSQPGVDTAGRH